MHSMLFTNHVACMLFVYICITCSSLVPCNSVSILTLDTKVCGFAGEIACTLRKNETVGPVSGDTLSTLFDL